MRGRNEPAHHCFPGDVAVVLERVVVGSQHVGEFISSRLLGLYGLIGDRVEVGAGSDGDLQGEMDDLGRIDPLGSLRDFYSSPELWLGVLAAGLLLAAAIWVRRYRDETS